MAHTALEAIGLTKTFGSVRALTRGDLRVEAGQIHALLGANGCGKSTLCKIVAGTIAPSGGELRWKGAARSFASPREAEQAGIALFYQELSLVPQLSVAHNIFLGREPRRFGFVDERALTRAAAGLISLFEDVAGPALVPHALAGDLAADERQIVEILKVFAQEPRLMIMDEATAALDGRQSARLFEILSHKRLEGVSTIMISHRLDEVFAVCDAITIMRNGETVATLNVAETDRQAVVSHMVGDVPRLAVMRGEARRDTPPAPAPAVTVRALYGPKLKNVSLDLAPGEIVGLGGLQGQGQSALLRTLFGAEARASGEMFWRGESVSLASPAKAVRAGFAYVSGDRGRDAALHGRSIFENLVAGILTREGGALVRGAALRPRAAASAQELKTRHSGLDAPIGSLSGGNQQKIFIARWLATRPALLLLDDPTKGIDLGAKTDLFALMRRLAEEGTSILFYSSEDSELLDHTDRCLVFNGGTVVTELSGDRLTATNLTASAYGEAA